jgi:cation transport regulator ChaB
MTFQVKNPNSKVALNLQSNYFELENMAWKIYGTDFGRLQKKEREEIALKVVEEKNYSSVD